MGYLVETLSDVMVVSLFVVVVVVVVSIVAFVFKLRCDQPRKVATMIRPYWECTAE